MNVFTALSLLNNESIHTRIDLSVPGKTGTVFKIGESLQFCIQPTFNATCMLLDINRNGVFRLFPVNKKQNIQIAADDFDCSMEIKASPPTGYEMVVAVGTSIKKVIANYNIQLGTDRSIFKWSYNNPTNNAADFCSNLFLSFVQTPKGTWAASTKMIQVIEH
jgi:hypothetical protein